MPRKYPSISLRKQERGTTAVEFAVVALAFLFVLFGIMEFGRLMYLFNSIQEVTRRAAREAVVTWTIAHRTTAFKRAALFGGSTLPAGSEVGTATLSIQYLTADGSLVAKEPASPADNIIQCENGTNQCIASVRVSVTGVTYSPMTRLFPSLSIPLPASTVTMPAESLGY